MIQYKVGLYDFKDLSGLVEANISFSRKAQYYKEWSKIIRSLSHVKRLTVPSWGLKLVDDFYSSNSCNKSRSTRLLVDCTKHKEHIIRKLQTHFVIHYHHDQNQETLQWQQ
ncbi:unnamed protein product [Dovyalis caffra]|uniref:Uncharacterized protein n=1 Tax=Dovyalis caffra TaxID=77055 RepID=A0AAV1SMW6_9ROSI|nr:unnamed protein product [Dovyalis caffra]